MIDYILFTSLFIVLYWIIVQAYNLTLGYLGILHLGQAGFYAIGAYTAALLRLGIPLFGIPPQPFWIAIPASFLIAGFAGFLIGIPSLRLKSHHLALATLGFGEIIRLILMNWVSLTNGPLGINKIPRPSFFGITFQGVPETVAYYLIFAIVINFIFYKIIHSPYGKALETIREDEVAAQALGKNTTRYKLEALSLSAGFTGIAGALYAHAFTYIDPTLFPLSTTIFFLILLIIGGVGNFWGALLGPILIHLIFEPLRFFGETKNIAGLTLNIGALRMMMYSALFVLIIILRPQGLIGRLKNPYRTKR